MATHSSVLAWRIPGTGEPGGCRLWGHTESDTTKVMQQQQLPILLTIVTTVSSTSITSQEGHEENIQCHIKQHTLVYLSVYADLLIISIGKAINLHSNLKIFEIIFTPKCRTRIMIVVVMLLLLIKPVALLLGYLEHFLPASLGAHSTYSQLIYLYACLFL